jgi:hypothetical protein
MENRLIKDSIRYDVKIMTHRTNDILGVNIRSNTYC